VFQGKRPLITASSSCGRVEEVEISVSVQLALTIVRAGRLIQVVPNKIQDDPRESSCEGVTSGAADALGLHRHFEGPFQSPAPVHLWASKRSRVFDSTSQKNSWGSGEWHSGDMACPSKKSTIIIRVEGLN
jgi:hypothetical protein